MQHVGKGNVTLQTDGMLAAGEPEKTPRGVVSDTAVHLGQGGGDEEELRVFGSTCPNRRQLEGLIHE